MLVIPQYTNDEIHDIYKIASVRIDVEEAIQRIKLLRILDLFNLELLPYTDAIMHMCGVIANSQPQLIREK